MVTGPESTSIAVLGALGVILTVHYFQGGGKQVRTFVNVMLTGRGPSGTSWFHEHMPGSGDGGATKTTSAAPAAAGAMRWV